MAKKKAKGISTGTVHSAQTSGRAAARSLMEGLRQAHYAAVTGDRRGLTVREIEIPDPPAMGPAQVRAIRSRAGVSVAVFAQMVGVTPAQIEHWEQGRRMPNAMARRLFDRIAADPQSSLRELIVRRGMDPRLKNIQ